MSSIAHDLILTRVGKYVSTKNILPLTLSGSSTQDIADVEFAHFGGHGPLRKLIIHVEAGDPSVVGTPSISVAWRGAFNDRTILEAAHSFWTTAVYATDGSSEHYAANREGNVIVTAGTGAISDSLFTLPYVGLQFTTTTGVSANIGYVMIGELL